HEGELVLLRSQGVTGPFLSLQMESRIMKCENCPVLPSAHGLRTNEAKVQLPARCWQRMKNVALHHTPCCGSKKRGVICFEVCAAVVAEALPIRRIAERGVSAILNVSIGRRPQMFEPNDHCRAVIRVAVLQ